MPSSPGLDLLDGVWREQLRRFMQPPEQATAEPEGGQPESAQPEQAQPQQPAPTSQDDQQQPQQGQGSDLVQQILGVGIQPQFGDRRGQGQGLDGQQSLVPIPGMNFNKKKPTNMRLNMDTSQNPYRLDRQQAFTPEDLAILFNAMGQNR